MLESYCSLLDSSWRHGPISRNINFEAILQTKAKSVTWVYSSGQGILTILEKSSYNSVRASFTMRENFCSQCIAIFMIAVSPAAYHYVHGGAFSALYASILGPFFLTVLLMFVSGLPLQERPGGKKRYESGNHWESYSEYTKRTSILIPFPPQLYERMPTILKRTIFLEFPLYVFDPAKHADQSKVQAREAEEGEREAS